jgi:hypothetical protein
MTEKNKYYVESGDLKVTVAAECPMWAAVRALHYNQMRKPGVLCTGDYCFVDERGFRNGSFAAHHIKTSQAFDVLEEGVVPLDKQGNKNED